MNYCIIAGVQKCGTSTMYELLCQHHEMCGAQAWETANSKYAPKELHVFNTFRYKRGIQWYRSHFKCTGYAMEATPEYITRKVYMRRLSILAPNAKIVMLTRDPVERFVSAWRHWSRSSLGDKWCLTYPGLNFLQSLEREYKMTDDLVNEGEFTGFLLRGLYKPQLEMAASFFGKDNIKMVALEDLRSNRAIVMQDLFKWLNLDPIRTHDVHANASDVDTSRPNSVIMDIVTNYYKEKASLIW